MTRRAFFSFEYSDVQRAMIVRNSWVTKEHSARGFVDAAAFEKLQRVGDAAVKRWIDQQLENTSVTVVLVGAKTCDSKWVKYEIEESKRRRNGLIGIDVSKVPNFAKQTSTRCGRIPAGYPFYLWVHDKGFSNLGSWIESAARSAGR